MQKQGKYGIVREIQPYSDGLGIRSTRKFFQKTLTEFAWWNQEFYNRAGIFPVTLRERQTSGGLYEAILKSSKQALIQPRIRRKNYGEKEKSGWADFIAYFDDAMLFIESKHSYCKLDDIKKSEIVWLTTDWVKAVKQVNSLGEKAVGDWGDGWHVHLGIVLHIVLIYQQAKSQSELKLVSEKRVVNYINSLNNKLKPKANWIWLWSLDTSLHNPEKFGKNWENYPYVCYFMYLKRLKYRSSTK